MANLYQTLGVKLTSSTEEVRRAYRILARRYHPDINDYNGLNEKKELNEKFLKITEAYQTLIDPQKRRLYDLSLKKYSYERTHVNDNKDKSQKITSATPKLKDLASCFAKNLANNKWIKAITTRISNFNIPDSQLTLEVLITLEEAIQGTKKTIQLPRENLSKKISVKIPPGINSGNIIRFRLPFAPLVQHILIVRIIDEPGVFLSTRGLVKTVSVTLAEAVFGCDKIVNGAYQDDKISIKIPAGTQSGDEIRVTGKGVKSNNGRGDLLIKILVHLPNCHSSKEYREKILELENFYNNFSQGKSFNTRKTSAYTEN